MARKMKVGIVTFHRADSYGANLQLYALYITLRKLGCDPEIVDYRCKAIENVYKARNFPKIRKNILAYIWNIYIYVCTHRDELKKIENFNQFRNTMKTSESFEDINKKKVIEKRYDLLVTGSDQVWSATLTGGPNEWYCYKRVTSHDIKIAAYAASAGSVKKFDENKEFYLPILRFYDYISVRENDLQEYLQKHLESKHIYRTIDPTLLVDSSIWEQLAGEKPLIKEKYIFNFDVQANDVSQGFAKYYANKTRSKIVVFNADALTIGKIIAVRDAGPLQFLNIIKFADAVVTSSFHGVALSIAMHKQVYPSLHSTTGARVLSLLENLGLSGRVIYDAKDYPKAGDLPEIDYSSINQSLESIRQESLTFLENIVKPVHRKDPIL